MKPLTPADLQVYAQRTAAPQNWIKVGLDTGGIAAGAGEVFDALDKEKQRLGLPVAVQRTGSVGLAYADPLVEISVEGMPRVMYGRVTPEKATDIINLHVIKHQLVDGLVMARRDRGKEIKAPTQWVLVSDTSPADGDKTQFFQFSMMEEIKRQKLEGKVQVVQAIDMGVYDEGVVVQLLPSGVTYTNVLANDVARIVQHSIQKNEVLEDLLFAAADKQVKVVLRNCGSVDPESLDDALTHQTYQAICKAVTKMTPEQVIAEFKASGLRGRGGAGFPTWMKWKLTRDVTADQKYMVCNGDEGDPGAFMDRSVLEGDPHAVLEGMMIAAYAIGATMGYFYIRAEYPMAVARVQKAIDQARARGLLGQNILGSSFCFDAKIRLGAGAFVCGEETALIASIEGKRGSPSPRPPYPSVKGLFGKPTAINNVETLAGVPAILLKGGEWYAQYGTEKSKGTKVFAVTGKVKNAQLVEVPMGITLREIVFEICGGVLEDKAIKAVQTGGPSGGVIPEDKLDTAISYESLLLLGSIMGSGGMIVMDLNDCMVDVAKFYLKFCVDESCGKCAPCRVGGYQMLQVLDRISRGLGKPADIESLRRMCQAMQKASLCGLGQTAPNPVLSTLRYFNSEYSAFIEGGVSYAKKMSAKAASAGK
ncbi:MAG: NADH-ubiquinone oxidoreductase-F iron-sulfur binding region domain-containing protein [Phycisphaerae bacterium]